MYNKKAQISEGITWIVATIAIIIILLVSVFITSLYVSDSNEIKMDFSDSIPQKSFHSYLLTKEPNGETIYYKIKQDEDLSDFNGNLALRIFKELYKEEYPVAVLLGINFEGFGIRKNDYFGSAPTKLRGGDISQRSVDFVSEKVILNDEKWVELVLMNK